MDRSSRSSTFAIAGFVIAVVATALVASVPGSPLHPVLPPGVEPGGPFRWLADALGLDDLHGSALVFASVAAVVASAIAFVFVVREAWRGHISLRTAVILAVGAHVVVATLPLLVSRDVYSYIAYGNIAGIHHANPYIQTPIDFPADAVVSLVGPKWLSTPAVYGPLFTGFASVVVRLVDSVWAQVQVFRMTALAASLGTLALIATTVRRVRPTRAAFAVAAFGMNPVVLFQSVGSGHNDLLVALAVAGAFALVLARREMLAVAALTLGALVKVTAGLPLLLLVVWCVARAPAGSPHPHAHHARRSGRGDRRGVRRAVLQPPRPDARHPRARRARGMAGAVAVLPPAARRDLGRHARRRRSGGVRASCCSRPSSSWCEPSGVRRSGRTTTGPPRRSSAPRGDGRSCC